MQKMFVVIEVGGKQYKVSEGQKVFVEKLNLDIGEVINYPVKMIHGCSERGTMLGYPTVDGVFATMKVISHEKDEKLVVFKFRRRKNSRRKNGHRQKMTGIEMLGVNKLDKIALEG